jgi:hypothetical protein
MMGISIIRPHRKYWKNTKKNITWILDEYFANNQINKFILKLLNPLIINFVIFLLLPMWRSIYSIEWPILVPFLGILFN